MKVTRKQFLLMIVGTIFAATLGKWFSFLGTKARGADLGEMKAARYWKRAKHLAG